MKITLAQLNELGKPENILIKAINDHEHGKTVFYTDLSPMSAGGTPRSHIAFINNNGVVFDHDVGLG